MRPCSAALAAYLAAHDNVVVADLYTFALANPDTLGKIPCTCGCERFGHVSNRSCYIKDEPADRVTFTSHAAT